MLLHSYIKTQRIVQYDSPTCRIVKTVHHKETANNNSRSQYLPWNLCPAPSFRQLNPCIWRAAETQVRSNEIF